MGLNLNLDAQGNIVKKDHRMTAVALLAVAAALFAFAVVSKRWLAISGANADGGFGPTGYSMCVGKTCSKMSFAEVEAKITAFDKKAWNSAFPVVGMITLALTVFAALTAAGAAVVGGLRGQGRGRSVISLHILVAALLLIAGCVFVACKPGQTGSGFGVGLGFWAFALACMAGIGGAILLGRELTAQDRGDSLQS